MIVLSCSHTSTCPLFPLLNASLASWRSSYCDDDVAWKGCARHKRSMQGRPVPLALLPNGHIPSASFDEASVVTEHLLEEGGHVSTVTAPAPLVTEPAAPLAAPEAGTHEHHPTTATWWQRLRNWFGGAA